MMSETERILLPKPAGYRCFGCGTMNSRGLNMEFYARGRTVCCDIILDEHYVGWENIAHGGIISTILDETMAWTVIAFKRLFFVTRSLEVRYLRPVQVGVPLTVVGEMESEHEKGCFVHGSVLDEKCSKLAVSKAEVTFLSEKRFPMMPEKYRRDMEAIFDQMRILLG